jgi:UDP-N-acetyl-D-galactosamine dehydrogenase
VVDPHADSKEVKKEYGFPVIDNPANNYDAVVVAVNHKQYKALDENYFNGITSDNGILVDVKGIYRGAIKNMTYWSL